MLARLGLAARGPDHDPVLVDAVIAFLDESHVGYDRFFFDFHGGLAREAMALRGPAGEHYGQRFASVRALLAAYGPLHPDRLDAPYFQGDAPCSLIIDEVRAIWDAIATRDDWEPFTAKIAAIRAMGEALTA